MEKYYTPSLEEFHVGFEYEYQAGTEEVFIPKVFNGFTSTEQISWVVVSLEHPTCLAPIFYRVKYLDKEDIESLGFEDITLCDGLEFLKDNINIKFYPWDWDSPKGKIIIRDIKYRDIVFLGWLKNKTELKKLLQQLNIQ